MEMIASSMMLVTITEEQTTHVGYKTRSTSGMGSALSRKSVKTNLSLLATTSSDCSMDVSDEESLNNSFYSNAISQENHADEWGFFVDGP